jgi:predicted SprT family Zn-dependent metalloprotease
MIPGYLAGAVRDRPTIGGYQYRARVHPHALRALERAQAEHGEPYPVCAACGGRLIYSGHRRADGQCQDCGTSPLTSVRHDKRARSDDPLTEVIGVLAQAMGYIGRQA